MARTKEAKQLGSLSFWKVPVTVQVKGPLHATSPQNPEAIAYMLARQPTEAQLLARQAAGEPITPLAELEAQVQEEVRAEPGVQRAVFRRDGEGKPFLHDNFIKGHLRDCLRGDTPVIVKPNRESPAIVEVRELAPGLGLWEQRNLNILSVTKTGGPAWTPLLLVDARPTQSPLVRVKYDSLVDVTVDHQLWSKDGRHSAHTFCRAGDYTTRAPVYSGLETVFQPRSWNEYTDYFRFSPLVELLQGRQPTTAMAYALGLFQADGWASWRGNDFKLAVTEPRFLERAKVGMEQLFPRAEFNISEERRPDRAATMYCLRARKIIPSLHPGAYLRAWFYNPFGVKRVPNFVLMAPEIFKEAYMEGVIDGDGWTREGGYTSITAGSKLEAFGLAILSRQLGHPTSMRPAKRSCPAVEVQLSPGVLRKMHGGLKLGNYPKFHKPIVTPLSASGEVVYDLCTGNEMFFASTFIAHNCGEALSRPVNFWGLHKFVTTTLFVRPEHISLSGEVREETWPTHFDIYRMGRVSSFRTAEYVMDPELRFYTCLVNDPRWTPALLTALFSYGCVRGLGGGRGRGMGRYSYTLGEWEKVSPAEVWAL